MSKYLSKTLTNIHHWRRAGVGEHLLEVAERLIVARGPERVSMALVARNAGVSRATVYNYFGDYRGLLTRFAAFRFGQLMAVLDAQMAQHAGRPRAQLEALLRASVASFERYDRFFRVMVSEYAASVEGVPHDALTQQIAQGMRQYVDRLAVPLRAGMRQRLFVGREPQRMAWAITGMVIHAVLRILQQSAPATRAGEVQIMENIIFHAALIEPAAARRRQAAGRRMVALNR
ncbi:MAG: TetR/AcrR family transcriptional regulator [Candidatus Omnitrophica bacterium]|nr:TetR/AcrR family transcriptional regulator [Candidatus Omnitrophota bacterium]